MNKYEEDIDGAFGFDTVNVVDFGPEGLLMGVDGNI